MSLQLIPVNESVQIEQVSVLAKKIWTEHFTSIIGQPQVDYMLDKFQSPEAIQSQVLAGQEYYLAFSENESVGYMSLVAEGNRMMVSKIYAVKTSRGLGIGKGMLDFVESKCAAINAQAIWLTVNKHNQGPISWYKRQGFSVVDSVKSDIGGGFFMDDYIMEKAVGLVAQQAHQAQ